MKESNNTKEKNITVFFSATIETSDRHKYLTRFDERVGDARLHPEGKYWFNADESKKHQLARYTDRPQDEENDRKEYVTYADIKRDVTAFVEEDLPNILKNYDATPINIRVRNVREGSMILDIAVLFIDSAEHVLSFWSLYELIRKARDNEIPIPFLYLRKNINIEIKQFLERKYGDLFVAIVEDRGISPPPLEKTTTNDSANTERMHICKQLFLFSLLAFYSFLAFLAFMIMQMNYK